jgi:ElaB/YqjD/DUF883 family membrane-anchored ribosome-binding protein
MAETQNMQQTMEDAAQTARDQAESRMARLRELTETARERGRDILGTVRERSGEALTASRGWVGENPRTAVAIGFAVGLLAIALWRYNRE